VRVCGNEATIINIIEERIERHWVRVFTDEGALAVFCPRCLVKRQAKERPDKRVLVFFFFLYAFSFLSSVVCLCSLFFSEAQRAVGEQGTY